MHSVAMGACYSASTALNAPFAALCGAGSEGLKQRERKPSVSMKDRGVAIRYKKTQLHVVPWCGLAYALWS